MNSRASYSGRLCTEVFLALILHCTGSPAADKLAGTAVLSPDSFQHYFSEFANDEQEMLGSAPPVPWDWFVANIPWLDIPDKEMERIYYFRWYAFQKHI